MRIASGLRCDPKATGSAAAPSRRNRARMPDSRALTSDSGCTWTTAGLVIPIVYQNLYTFRDTWSPRCQSQPHRATGAAQWPAGHAAVRPHPGRVYDYLIGGQNNFAADRETAAKVLLKSPTRASPRARTGPSLAAQSGSWPAASACGSSSTSARACRRRTTSMRSRRRSSPRPGSSTPTMTVSSRVVHTHDGPVSRLPKRTREGKRSVRP